ncbi:uncharacterized protein LOC127252321 [Andrographis paniculata]|uniref:uncharacterized protein LOC127252321 n=1 Tax=Andrographis paniculata TaxID=175694 RepID=UPI0021E9892C|nr:uncharacterized protein LOC127252321 [Andrographis paniculata]
MGGGDYLLDADLDSVSGGDGRSSVVEIRRGGKSCSQNNGDSVFGSVPSRFEVEKAILDLERFMSGLSNSKSELNGVKGLLHDQQSKILEAPGFAKFMEAFSMMRSDPAFQKSVASISSDKAVWEALMSNKAVRRLQDSIPKAKQQELLTYSEEPDIAILILKWITDFTKAKILELVDKFLLLVNEILQPVLKRRPSSDRPQLLDEKVRSSFVLSVVIILIVITTRSQG